MTGGTLIVKSGNFFAMTKVAHEGMDLANIQAMKTLITNSSTIDDIFVSYLRGRGGIDFEPLDVMNDQDVVECYIVDEYTDGRFDGKSIKYVIEKMSSDLSDECEEQELDDEHPWVQLSCDYSDYVLFVDEDSGWLNGNRVW